MQSTHENPSWCESHRPSCFLGSLGHQGQRQDLDVIRRPSPRSWLGHTASRGAGPQSANWISALQSAQAPTRRQPGVIPASTARGLGGLWKLQ